MTTYYVNNSTGNDSNSGTSSGSPWKNVTTAHSRIAAGDTVLLQTSTWKQRLIISKPNTTWKAQPGHTPRFDGNYHYGLMSNSWVMPTYNAQASFVPGDHAAGMIDVQDSAHHTTIEGIIVQNIAGQGIRVMASYGLVKGCIIHFIYSGGIQVKPPAGQMIDGTVVEGCQVTAANVHKFDPLRPKGGGGQGGEAVGRSVNFWEVRDGIFRNNFIGFGYGEGFDVGKGNIRALVEDNVFAHFNHTSLYCMHSTDTILRRNALFVALNIGGGWDGQLYGTNPTAPSAGIRFTDEEADDKGWTTGQQGAQIYDNIVVDFKVGIEVNSGPNGNAITAIKRLYIGYNTIICGNWGGVGLKLNDGYPTVPRWHEGIVENNLVDHAGHPVVRTGDGNFRADRLVFRNNLWTIQPTAKMRGTNDQTGAPNLKNPYVAITGRIPTTDDLTSPVHNFNPDNYKPTQNSIRVIGKAIRNGSAAYDTTPPADADRDFLKYGRGNQHDIGAVEYDGDSTPVNEVVANFSFTPLSGVAPLTVQFTDTSTVGGAAVINARSWDFGDGTTGTTTNPSHVYATAGTYTPRLTVQDTTRGLSSTHVGAAITVSSPDTVDANFSRTPASGNAPLTVTFTDTSTKTGAAVINEWAWEFGDGTTATVRHPVKVYAAPGTYTPRLTVRDTVRGLADSVAKLPVTVNNPTADSLLAAFEATPLSGTAPLTVTFTDESVAGGAAVANSWLWEFGDGTTSTVQNPVKTYALPGTYTPRLTVSDTVLGVGSTAVGSAIVVHVGGEEGDADVALRVTRAALRVTDGLQTISTAALGGLVPKSAILVATGATADGTAVDGGRLSYGMVSGVSRQVAAAVATQHGAETTAAARRQMEGACLLVIDHSGAEVARATFVEWVADGVTVEVEWTGTPAAYLVTARFGAGLQYEAWVGSRTLAGLGSEVEVTGLGFAPDVVRAVSTWSTLGEAADDASLSLGLAHRQSPQLAMERTALSGKGTALMYSRLQEDRVALTRYAPGGRAGARVSAFGGQGATLAVMNDGINAPVLLMMEKFGSLGSRVALVNTPTATGSVDYGLEWDPQYTEHFLSVMGSLGASNESPKAGTVGVHMADAAGEFSNLMSGENVAGVTNEQSLSDNQLIIVGHTGATLAAGATTMGVGKYTVAYSAAGSPAQALPSLAVEVGQSIGGGAVTAEFTGSPLAGAPPLAVAFTDLSASQLPIASWAWEFGDGAASDEQNPVHTYMEDGTYTVSLTVGDGTNEATMRKGGYVVVASPLSYVGQMVAVGPLRTRTVTERSETATHYHRDDPEMGWVDVGLDLGFLSLADSPATPEAGSGEVRFFFDSATGALRVVRSDGATGTVAITWG